MAQELSEINNSEDVIRNVLTRASDDDVEDLKKYFYIALGIYGFIILVLIGLVIGLYVWVNKITTSENKDGERRYRNDDLMREPEYKISRPKINNENPFKRFTLPNKPENDINSDVFYGGSGSNKNPLSQPSALHRSKSFGNNNNMKQFEGGRGNRTGDSNPLSPTSKMPDYYSFNDRNKFAY